MSNATDRRAPGTCRVPFEAMVEVGGALGPSFEAQAVNLSEEGMSLRTTYLPEVGQPVMCRFDAGHGMAVVAAGEVLWKDDIGDGGEFGIRFTNLDAQSTVALQRVLGMADDGRMIPMAHGRKVRLHIDGLASPMRARVKDQTPSGVTAYSELGFLRMGRPLELEDAASGSRRPALIDRVQVEVDDGSRIPQLVVSLRYDDSQVHDAVAPTDTPVDQSDHTSEDGHPGPLHMQHEDAADPAFEGGSYGHTDYARASDIDAAPPVEHEKAAPADAKVGIEDEEAENNLKSAFARKAAKVTPALLAWAKRAKIAAALLAARARKGSGDDVEIPMRRTTAPAPGGGLHTAGRKVVRGSAPDEREARPNGQGETQPTSRFKITKKKLAIAGSIGVASVLVFLALRKPAPAPQLASAPAADTNAAAATAAPVEAPAAPASVAKPVPPPADPLAAAAAAAPPTTKPGRPTPFVNGNVGAHPNVIKIKMDGAVEGIQGAAQPTGFTVVVPNRKSLEPTTSLVERDSRIAAINVSNEASGAELSVTFKDGVPPYMVRAHGDTLELVLAKASAHGEKAEAHAKKKKGKKHSR